MAETRASQLSTVNRTADPRGLVRVLHTQPTETDTHIHDIHEPFFLRLCLTIFFNILPCELLAVLIILLVRAEIIIVVIVIIVRGAAISPLFKQKRKI